MLHFEHSLHYWQYIFPSKYQVHCTSQLDCVCSIKKCIFTARLGKKLYCQTFFFSHLHAHPPTSMDAVCTFDMQYNQFRSDASHENLSLLNLQNANGFPYSHGGRDNFKNLAKIQIPKNSQSVCYTENYRPQSLIMYPNKCF